MSSAPRRDISIVNIQRTGLTNLTSPGTQRRDLHDQRGPHRRFPGHLNSGTRLQRLPDLGQGNDAI